MERIRLVTPDWREQYPERGDACSGGYWFGRRFLEERSAVSIPPCLYCHSACYITLTWEDFQVRSHHVNPRFLLMSSEPQTLQDAATAGGRGKDEVEIRLQDGFDHSYYFVRFYSADDCVTPTKADKVDLHLLARTCAIPRQVP